ncbi:HupE/UreJ family protein [Variovorax sp. PvP013]|uniref:HupE/UreJ family protein n=1 Tax=Variovorax sp. PvP013 TaxID=3156435 RepID=UPI003D22B40D
MHASMRCFDLVAPKKGCPRLRRTASIVLAVCLAWLYVAPSPARAHKASDAYLLLARSGSGDGSDVLDVRLDIALRDLDAVLDLDRDANRRLTWGEVRARLDEIQAYARSRLRLQQGRCVLTPSAPAAIDDRVDGAYLVLAFQSRCQPTATLEVEYRLFQEVDPTHRGLLRVAGEAGGAGGTAPSLRSLDPAAAAVVVDWPGAAVAVAEATPSTDARAPGDGFFRDGVHHILIGYDHVLFLVCLLLPAVLRRRADGGREPVARWREAVWPMVGLVTMFTVAHSITLALASFQLVTISPRVVEPAIALTIMVAALDNLHPVLRGRRRLFSFLFGLIHGFGFASVLGELDLPVLGFASALLQFNLGVEAGQLAIVSVVLAVLLALRRWRAYPVVVLRGGSVVAIALATLWLVERVFDLQLIST